LSEARYEPDEEPLEIDPDAPPEDDDWPDEDDEVGNDPELLEDLRRAETNPPQTVPRTDDACGGIDLGYAEDRETEHDDVELRWGIERETVDPLEEEREVREQPPRPRDGETER
jgi:hypothetical protein